VYIVYPDFVRFITSSGAVDQALISKRLGLERYKLVLLGHIFQNGEQSVRVASKCLWDPQNDNFADYNYVNDELMCSIQVFGIYIQ